MASSNIREFELDEKFKEKYPDFTRIYIKGKNLILEHFKGGLIISKYYDDDISKTLNALEETFVHDSRIGIDFVHSDSKQFLIDLKQMLGWKLIQDPNTGEEKDDRSVAGILVDLMTENSNLFFKDQYETPWVRVHNGDHYELIKLTGDKFKRYLSRLYYNSEGWVPYTEALLNATSVLRAKAEYEGESIPLSLRVAWNNNDIIYDLTNEKWQCVKITKRGWETINDTHMPLFMRYNQTPQVYPSKEYRPDILDKFLQLVNLKREQDKILLIVYIITLFIPGIQHVALQLHGEKGGAKSMLEEFVKELVDPAVIKLLSIHNDRMEFIQQIAHNYLVFYDNLKYIPGWLSDEVCRAITGSGSSKRVLYSDDDDHVIQYRRCFGFNGINLVLTEPDALDRSIALEQDRIRNEDRIPELLMWSKFYELRPQLLGYIFDILVKALQIHPTIKLSSLPRMGDFAKWGEAIARAMDYRKLEFIHAYFENIGRQNIETLENSALGQAVTTYLNHWSNDVVGKRPACWFGLTSDFLKELTNTAVEHNIDMGKYWPRAANSLTRKLKIIMTSIRDGLGYDITITKITTGENKGASVVRIRQISSLSSLSSLEQNQARNEDKSSEDTLGSEDMYPHREGISSPENGRDRAQNRVSKDSKGSKDTFPVLYESENHSYRCYHNGCKCGHTCDFQTDSKVEYEKHGALKHPKNPLLYPSNSEIKKYKLTPQGKSWEK